MGNEDKDEKYLKEIADSAVDYTNSLIKKKEFSL